jgi:hypothetical protein
MKDLVYEVEIKREDQLRERRADAANLIRNKNKPEMLGSASTRKARLGRKRCTF